MDRRLWTDCGEIAPEAPPGKWFTTRLRLTADSGSPSGTYFACAGSGESEAVPTKTRVKTIRLAPRRRCSPNRNVTHDRSSHLPVMNQRSGTRRRPHRRTPRIGPGRSCCALERDVRSVSSAFRTRDRRVNSCWQCDFPAGENGCPIDILRSNAAQCCGSLNDHALRTGRHDNDALCGNAHQFAHREAWNDFRRPFIAPPLPRRNALTRHHSPMSPLTCGNTVHARVSDR